MTDDASPPHETTDGQSHPLLSDLCPLSNYHLDWVSRKGVQTHWCVRSWMSASSARTLWYWTLVSVKDGSRRRYLWSRAGLS